MTKTVKILLLKYVIHGWQAERFVVSLLWPPAASARSSAPNVGALPPPAQHAPHPVSSCPLSAHAPLIQLVWVRSVQVVRRGRRLLMVINLQQALHAQHLLSFAFGWRLQSLQVAAMENNAPSILLARTFVAPVYTLLVSIPGVGLGHQRGFYPLLQQVASSKITSLVVRVYALSVVKRVPVGPHPCHHTLLPSLCLCVHLDTHRSM